MAKSRLVGPFTQTVRANQSSVDGSMYVQNWDKVPGIGQHQDRVIARELQGQKKTPVGRTTLHKSRVSRS